MCPSGSRRFVPAALAATLLLSGHGRADEDVATREFNAGIEARKASDLEAARQHFAAAFQAMPQPRMAVKLAQTELELGRHREAAEHFRYYLGRKEPSAADRAAALGMLDEAKRKIGVLEVRVDEPGAEILVDRAVVGVLPLDGEVFVDPGKRVVEARKDGCSFEPASLELGPGSTQVVSFLCKRPLMEPLPPTHEKPDRGMPTWKMWAIPATAGVAAVGIGVGIGLRVHADGLSKEADAQLLDLRERTLTTQHVCGPGSPSANANGCADLKATLRSHDLSANASTGLFIAGGAFAAGAIVMALWPSPKPKKVQVVPVVRRAEGGIVVVGSF